MVFAAGLAFVGVVAVMSKSIFLPMKFCFTVVVSIAAVLGLTVAVFQESWFKIVGCNGLAVTFAQHALKMSRKSHATAACYEVGAVHELILVSTHEAARALSWTPDDWY